MATIFSAKADREVLTWVAGSSAIITDNMDVADFAGTETFTIEVSGSGPSSIGPFSTITGFPWTDEATFETDMQTELDLVLGSNQVRFRTMPGSSPSSASYSFTDVSDISTEISLVTNTIFERFPVPNLLRDTTVCNNSINPQAVAPGGGGGWFPPFYMKPDISSLYTIPEGANELTLWVSVEANDGVDGYEVGVNYFTCWTNGTDGYATDGYLYDLMFEALDQDIVLNPSTTKATTTSGFAFRIAKSNFASGVLGSFSVPISGVNFSKSSTAVRIPVPVGTTGFYLVASNYVNDTIDPDPKTAFPPTFTVAATAGTR